MAGIHMHPGARDDSQLPRAVQGLILFLIFIVSIAVRLWVFFITRGLMGDGDMMYLIFARNICEGKFHLDYGGWGNGFWFQPGYSALTAFFNIFVNDIVISAQLVSIVGNSLVIFPLFYLVRRLFGHKIAYISSALFIAYPALAVDSTRILTEPVFTFLFILFIYIGYIAIAVRRNKISFLSGILVGLSFLIKETGLVVGLILGLWIGISSLKRKRGIMPSLAFVLGILLVIMPWLLYLRAATGGWVLVPKTGYNLCLYYKFKGAILNPDATGFVITEESKDVNLVGLFLESPQRVIKHAAVNMWKIYKYIIPEKLSFLPIGLFFLGLFDIRDKEVLKKTLYLLSFFMPFFILYPLVAVYGHYFIPLLPLCIIWMARGTATAAEAMSLLFNRRLYLTVSIIIFLLVFLSFAIEIKLGISNMLKADNGWQLANKDVGLWIRGHKEKARPLIISRTPHAVFFAGGEYVFLPQENPDRILKFAHHLGADYIVLDRAFNKAYPALETLFTLSHPNLKLIYRYDNFGQEMLVFSL